MKDTVLKGKLPAHVAVIMDGNGRWAKQKGAERIFGHQNAIKAVREITEGCGELGISYLTLYAFSTENWNRPKNEVEALMELLVSTIRSETETLTKNKVRLKVVGKIENLPQKCQKELEEAIEITKDNEGLTMIVALSYSGRWEIAEAAKNIARDVKKGLLDPEQVDDMLFANYLQTKDFPDPELLIRTSGEMRISNFLLWQIAYTELFITEVLWPDFRREHLYEAILAYQKRERRFGLISEQVN